MAPLPSRLSLALALAVTGGSVALTLPHQTAQTKPISQVTIANATMVYYDITGNTAAQLRAQLNAKGPLYRTERFDALTQWFVRWNWPGYGSPTCRLQNAVVSYEVKVTFPRWRAPANASPALVQRWNRYMQALALHERGHVDHLANNYQTVATAIQRATCTTAEAAAQNALGPLRQYDLDYDRATNHGATQGARFP